MAEYREFQFSTVRYLSGVAFNISRCRECTLLCSRSAAIASLRIDFAKTRSRFLPNRGWRKLRLSFYITHRFVCGRDLLLHWNLIGSGHPWYKLKLYKCLILLYFSITLTVRTFQYQEVLVQNSFFTALCCVNNSKLQGRKFNSFQYFNQFVLLTLKKLIK